MFRPRTAIFVIIASWAVIIFILYSRRTDISNVVKENILEKKVEEKKEVVQPTPTTPTIPTTKGKEDKEISKEEPDFQGEIMHGKTLCLDTLENKDGKVGLWECHGEGRNQYWYITKDQLIKNNLICVQAPPEQEKNRLARLKKCNGGIKEQKWIYKDGALVLKDTQQCLDARDTGGLIVVPCDQASAKQKFTLEVAAGDLGA